MNGQKILSNMYSDTRRIGEAYPNVACIDILYKRLYTSAFGVYGDKDFIPMHCKADSQCAFVIECRNNTCTYGCFDLHGEVMSMLAHHETQREGTMECKGKEAEDHPNRCPCRLEYKITVEYKS